MIILEILAFLFIVPFFVYRIISTYQKRVLTEWLEELSDKYGVNAPDVRLFHLKLVAMDTKRGVLVLLDNKDGKKNGHIIGLQEIAACDLLIHETNKKAFSHNIDGIDLQLILNTGNKKITFPIYEKTFFSSLNKRRLQNEALDFYEELSVIVSETENAVGLIA